jgi:hypothetical protein
MLSSSSLPNINERFFQHFTAEEEGSKIFLWSDRWLMLAEPYQTSGQIQQVSAIATRVMYCEKLS